MRLIDADTLMQAVNEEASFIREVFLEDDENEEETANFGWQRLNELTRVKVLIANAPTILTGGGK